MKKRAAILLAAAIAVAAVVIVLAVILSRQRLRRHRVFRVAPAETPAKPPATVPPVERWTATFATLDANDLADLLDRIERRHPDLYSRYSLAYLHARALIESDELVGAATKLAPFLSATNPFHDLAEYHQSEIDDERGNRAAASAHRQELIFQHARSMYRQQAIDEEADDLSSQRDPAALWEFVHRVTPSIDTATRRDLTSRLVIRTGDVTAGLALLRAGTTDDAADRVSRALDRPEIVRSLAPAQCALLGETFLDHRHYDRAIALLSPAAVSDELRFSLGRAYFGAERFAEAQQVYLRGANAAKDPKMKATFFFHASRAAQLRGDDAGAERLMTAAIAVRGTFPATTAALTQRIRTRVKQKRLGEAAADLQLLRKIAPNEHALVEGALAFALGSPASTVATLNSVPPKLLDRYDAAEFAYWRARALERSDPPAAFLEYLTVLRASVPTHFAYFARERLDAPEMAPKLARALAVRDAQVTNLIASKQFALAKQIQTDRILLSAQNRGPALQRLAAIYREIPAYRAILELRPKPLPAFPLQDPSDRTAVLLAMGLYDEAAEDLGGRYPLRPAQSALTRALVMNRGSASRQSIYAVEVLMKSVPSDFVPDLLPLLVRQLLYPRYFYGFIEADAKKYNADPVLVLAIMREESRFNPRAKSAAAARGLLQFIITTARDIGRDVGMVDVQPEDLYDPRVIIRLGAKYVAELSEQLGGDRYKTAAAYNAGPKQVALWSRLAPAAGEDTFLSAVNFDETKNYVRTVMNSYRRYNEIYGHGRPAGGLRVEP